MDYFQYHDNQLCAEEVALSDIATAVGTPCFVYSKRTIERHWNAFNDALGDYPHQICYAVKANGNLAILNLLAKLGSGFDIVSGGELRRVLAAKGDAANTIFSGVCKLDWEIREALEHGVGCFNIESEGELEKVSEIAKELGKIAKISVRINPDVNPKTHPYISTGLKSNKFGLSPERTLAVYLQASNDPNIEINGVACHIGSQLTEMSPYQDALACVLKFVDQMRAHGINVNRINLGGGLGVRYCDESPPSPKQYWQGMYPLLKDRPTQIPVTIEPGRAIMANAGILLTRVNYLKPGQEASFCMVDAGMNDLIRPALYQAYQEIVEVKQNSTAPMQKYDVVGPVCESSDFLGKDRCLQVRVGDLLAVRTSGAYCSVMGSNYNARPRPAEVLVDGKNWSVIRHRESLHSLFKDEIIP